MNEGLYNLLFTKYKKNKLMLRGKGITSFSGFVTNMLNEKVEEESLRKKYLPIIEKIGITSNSIMLKDNSQQQIVELKVVDNILYCNYDKKRDCAHVGFAYSLPETYILLDKI